MKKIPKNAWFGISLLFIGIVFFAVKLKSDLVSPLDGNTAPSYEEVAQNFIDKSTKNDTTFLGFVFGWSEFQTESHISYLQGIRKLGLTQSWDLSWVKISGYEYQIYLDNETRCDAVMSVQFWNGYLSELNLFVFNTNKEKVVNFLNSKYGKPNYIEKSADRGNDTHWLTDGKDVMHSEIGLVNAIVFSSIEANLKKRKADKEDQEQQDKIEDQRAKAAKSDFK